MNIVPNQNFSAGAVGIYPLYRLVADISKVDSPLSNVKINGHNIAQIHLHQVVQITIQTSVSEVVAIAEDQPWRNIVFSLARVAIQLAVVIGQVAFTEVGTRRVDAILAAHRGFGPALVYVGAGLAVLEQFIALVALAVEAGQGVDTLVLALVQLHLGTLIHVAVGWLVRAIRAVLLLVAHTLIRNALAALAPELGPRAGGLLLLAVFLQLVAAVPTVVLPVAVVGLADALGIATRELLRTAVAERAVAGLV